MATGATFSVQNLRRARRREPSRPEAALELTHEGSGAAYKAEEAALGGQRSTFAAEREQGGRRAVSEERS